MLSLKLDKAEKKRIELYFDFIKRNYCVDCGKFDHWDEARQTPIVSASHVLAKGTTRRNEHYGNLVPQCTKYFCHQKFEFKTPDQRLAIHGETAQRLLDEFNQRYPRAA